MDTLPGVPESCPPGPDGLRTADAHRSGSLRITSPARPPGHPRTNVFLETPPGTSSGQPPTGLSQNIRPSPPGRYLFAEVCVQQTALLTGSIEMPLTSDRDTRSDTIVTFYSAYCVFERAPKPRHTFYEFFDKYGILKVRQKFLAPPKDCYADAFFGLAPLGAGRLPPPRQTA